MRQKKIGNIKLIDTEDIHARIYFYDTDCVELKKLSHEKAFWFNSKPRVQRKNQEDHIHIVPASGKAAGVCLVVRKEGERDLYVFSDDSYYPGTTNIVFDKSMKITKKNVYIYIELSSANAIINPIWIKLSNLGKNKQPLFELINNPCNKSSKNS